MAFWWVNQGSRFVQERALSCLWAPKASKSGRIVSHWKALEEMKVGDFVIHNSHGLIRLCSKVISEAISAPQPTTQAKYLENWDSRNGNLIKLHLIELDHDIPVASLPEKYRCDRSHSNAFSSGGRANQGYLFKISEDFGRYILQLALDDFDTDIIGQESLNLLSDNSQKTIINSDDDDNYYGQQIWIFQGNPKKFNLKSALSSLTSITWLVNRHKDKISKDDLVYFWQSGEQSGIIGSGIVLSEPIQIEIPDEELSFILDDDLFKGEQLRVFVDILEFLEKPLLRSTLIDDVHLRNLSILKSCQGTNFLVRPLEARYIDQLIVEHQRKTQSAPRYTHDQLIDETNHAPQILERITRALNRKKQIILTGAPGSGKTHLAQNLAKHLTSETDGIIETIQLHPAYTYEDFIQGLRPIADENGQLSYQMIPGRFLDFCDRARNRTGKSVLIIDEINRANLPSVFGELLYLLEYRNQSIKLAGSDRPFSIPENVYIIGTMNTADRSIALVDHALRRRFAFIELRPDYSILQKWHDRENTGFNPNGLIETLHKINDIIDDKHYEIGISFFLDRNLKDNIADIWELEIYPYLEELFYSDLGKIEQFRWENIEAKIRHDQDFSNG